MKHTTSKAPKITTYPMGDVMKAIADGKEVYIFAADNNKIRVLEGSVWHDNLLKHGINKLGWQMIAEIK
jgi:hypothetical protein